MSTCIYCLRTVIEGEPGAAYWIVEADESLLWAHTECLEQFEDVKVEAWQL